MTWPMRLKVNTPHCHLCCGAPSEFRREDSCGSADRITQVGYALKPLHFAVGQHSASEEASAQVLPS